MNTATLVNSHNASSINEEVRVQSEYSSTDRERRLSQILEVTLRVSEIALALIVCLGIIGIVGTNPLLLSSLLLGSLLFGEFATPYLPLKARRAVHWVNGAGKEFLTLPIHIFFYFYRLEKQNPDASNLKGNKPLVIASHGYLHNSSAWIYGRRRLQSAGFNFVTLTKRKMFASIDQYAEQIEILSQKYFDYIQKNGVVLLGHSMGGIAACKAADLIIQRHPLLKNKIQVITLASPLQGTHLAKIGIGKCAREMERNSPYIATLNRRIEEMEKNTANFYHITSTVDLIVLPHQSASRSLPESCHNHTSIQNHGHLSLLFSDNIFDKVIESIN
ncbi:MAG: hypothetical protein WDZ27_07170 [Waddliaceae bacterium]